VVVLPKSARGSYACFNCCQERENSYEDSDRAPAIPDQISTLVAIAQDEPSKVHWVMKSDLAAAKQKGATRVTW
jgi:hypothetical protein